MKKNGDMKKNQERFLKFNKLRRSGMNRDQAWSMAYREIGESHPKKKPKNHGRNTHHLSIFRRL